MGNAASTSSSFIFTMSRTIDTLLDRGCLKIPLFWTGHQRQRKRRRKESHRSTNPLKHIPRISRIQNLPQKEVKNPVKSMKTPPKRIPLPTAFRSTALSWLPNLFEISFGSGRLSANPHPNRGQLWHHVVCRVTRRRSSGYSLCRQFVLRRHPAS